MLSGIKTAIGAFVLLMAVLPFWGHAASFHVQNPPAKPGADAMHGQPWAFGQSRGRNDALWQRGISGEAMQKRARPHRGNAVDTSGGIQRALKDAEKKPKAGMGMSMEDQTGNWKVAPGAMRAGELRPRDRQHVVRAFADVQASDDLDINIGPELILKDERMGNESASEKQPDSSLGVGMRFKYDF